MRGGPFTPSQRVLPRLRRALFNSLSQPPRFHTPPAGEDRALMILAPWVIHGGVDRALVDLLQGLARLAPHQRRYLVTTNSHDRPGAMTWADEILPCVSGTFCVPDLAPQGHHAFIAELAKRLNVGAILNANSLVGFDALPRLRLEVPGLRVISQAHTFPKDPVTGELFGVCAFSASKYNNLIDGYATICQETADRLVQHFYVSPSKVRIVMLGVDTARFGAAHRPRFVPGVRPRVLWLGRLAPEKNPLMCLQIARLWKQRHGSARLGFHITGSGSEEAALHAYVREHGLHDVVTLESAVDDPVPQYQQADCLLLTSLYEGIPVVIYEAMAAGLPVVASVKNTSIPDVLSPKEAWLLADPSGPEDYVAALEELLAKPAEVHTRSERMREASARYDRLRYARETLEMLFPEPRQEPLKRAAP
ncbi:glycosyltransferase family 4 protein [Pyxidicoccus sp. 3LFB2]